MLRTKRPSTDDEHVGVEPAASDDATDGVREDVHEDVQDVREDVVVRHRVVRTWAIVAVVMGLASIVFGVWGLARTGLNTDHIFSPTKEVLGVHVTPALALGAIGFGALLIIAASMRSVGRVLVAILGVAAIAAGVMVLWDSLLTSDWNRRIDRWTDANDTSGWVAVVTGAVLLLTALFAPTLRSDRETHERVISSDARRSEAEAGTTAAVSSTTAPPARTRRERRHWWQPVHGHRAGA